MSNQSNTMSLSSVITAIAPILMMQQTSDNMMSRILTILILQCISNIGAIINNIKKLFQLHTNDTKQTVILTCSNTFKDGVYSGSYANSDASAVMYVLSMAAMESRLGNIKFSLQTMSITLCTQYVVCMDVGTEAMFFTKDGEQVFVSSNYSESTASGTSQSCNVLIKTCNIYLRPGKCSKGVIAVKAFINECVDKYNNEVTNKTVDHSIFVLHSFVGVGAGGARMPSFKDIKLNTTKSFDNMFFDGKDTLIKRISDFETSEERYKRLGIPYSLGMMFHGAPGCGKTSCIKAIAKMTGRHIINIPLKLVNNIEDLKELFQSTHIQGHTIPMSKRLYVFEEIDCGHWKNVVKSRKMTAGQHDDAHNNNLNGAQAMVECMKMMMYSKKDKDDTETQHTFSSCNITLGELLELLDGIVEMPGRMIILTSNHPSQIDEALLRPGRIDITLEFKRMTRHDIAKMYRLWFNKDMPPKVYERVRDYVFSQADIGNLFSGNRLDMIHSGLLKST